MRELTPVRVTNINTVWINIVNGINLRPDTILPVHYIDEQDNSFLGSFHACFITEGQKRYLQLENFSSIEWAEIFFSTFDRTDWQILIDGIYRLELSSNL